MQEPRTLDDIDLLLQRQEQLRAQLGEEFAAEVRACPENFADAEAFRNYHAKARFRATLTTVGALVGGSVVAARATGLPSGMAFINANKLVAYPAIIGVWCSSYFVWNRIVGWNHKQRN